MWRLSARRFEGSTMSWPAIPVYPINPIHLMRTRSIDVQRSGHPSPPLQRGIELEDIRAKGGHMFGRLLEFFRFGEVRGAVEQVLGVKVSNGNGGVARLVLHPGRGAPSRATPFFSS